MTNNRTGSLKIDHITVAGKEVESLMKTFRSMGIGSLYGGKHSTGLTEMAIVGLGDESYIELVSATDEANPGDIYWWKSFIQENAGICAWCIRSGNIEKDTKDIAETGLSTEGPKDFTRCRPDGTPVKWKLTFVDNQEREPGTIFPFLIEDQTVRSLRVPEEANLSAELLRVGRVMIGVRDADKVILQFMKLYQLQPPVIVNETEEVIEYHFEQTPMILGEPKTMSSPLGQRLSRFGECLYGVVLEVEDLEKAQQSFQGFNQKEFLGDHVVLWHEAASNSILKKMKLGIIEERSCK